MKTLDEIIGELEQMRNKLGGDYKPRVCIKMRCEDYNEDEYEYYYGESIDCEDFGEIDIKCPIV